jgi:hypothetical protein
MSLIFRTWMRLAATDKQQSGMHKQTNVQTNKQTVSQTKSRLNGMNHGLYRRENGMNHGLYRRENECCDAVGSWKTSRSWNNRRLEYCRSRWRMATKKHILVLKHQSNTNAPSSVKETQFWNKQFIFFFTESVLNHQPHCLKSATLTTAPRADDMKNQFDDKLAGSWRFLAVVFFSSRCKA